MWIAQACSQISLRGTRINWPWDWPWELERQTYKVKLNSEGDVSIYFPSALKSWVWTWPGFLPLRQLFSVQSNLVELSGKWNQFSRTYPVSSVFRLHFWIPDRIFKLVMLWIASYSAGLTSKRPAGWFQWLLHVPTLGGNFMLRGSECKRKKEVWGNLV